MKCPICKNEMHHKPLIDAIVKGLAIGYQDEDIPKWVFDEIIKHSEYAVCRTCNFVMLPPKEN